MSVKAPIEKNFRRSKTRPSKRRMARRSWSWRAVRGCLLVAIALFVGYRATRLVATASALQVQEVRVKGNVRLTVRDVQALVDDLRGTNILTADLDAYRRRVLESRWIADVALRRVLPSTVELFVSERRPIGLCRMDGELYLVDGTGTLIDLFGSRYAEFDLPIIDGLVAAPGTNTPTIDAGRADLAARVIEGLSRHRELARRVSQIDVSDVQDAVVLIDGDPARLRVGNSDFAERLQRYLDVAKRLREHVADADYVDLRFSRGIFVGPREHADPRRAGTRTQDF